MNHNDREALGFLVIGVIVILLAAIGLLSCQPAVFKALAPALIDQKARFADI